jgi:hypothetical protein|tara:strand:- start:576 stop:887 length:312 start_codon:yes stop_codon:yes gene_type:complete
MKLSREDFRQMVREMCGDGVAEVTPITHSPVISQNTEQAHPAKMARSALFTIAAATQSLHDRLEDGDELPEWVRSKIASVLDDVHEIEDHLDYKIHRLKTGDR